MTVGASGFCFAGMALADMADQSLSPSRLPARTRTLYAVPFVRAVLSAGSPTLTLVAVSALVSPERSVQLPHVLLDGVAASHVFTEVLPFVAVQA